MCSPHGTGYTVVGTHKGDIGGLQKMTYSHSFAAAVDTPEQFVCSKCGIKYKSLKLCSWKSNIHYLC